MPVRQPPPLSSSLARFNQRHQSYDNETLPASNKQEAARTVLRGPQWTIMETPVLVVLDQAWITPNLDTQPDSRARCFTENHRPPCSDSKRQLHRIYGRPVINKQGICILMFKQPLFGSLEYCTTHHRAKRRTWDGMPFRPSRVPLVSTGSTLRRLASRFAHATTVIPAAPVLARLAHMKDALPFALYDPLIPSRPSTPSLDGPRQHRRVDGNRFRQEMGNDRYSLRGAHTHDT